MTDTDDGMASLALSKDEAMLYRYILRRNDADPDKYLSARRLVFPPDHYAEVAGMYAKTSAKEMKNLQEGPDRTSEQVVAAVDRMMSKLAKALQDEGLEHDAQEEMISRGVEDMLDK